MRQEHDFDKLEMGKISEKDDDLYIMNLNVYGQMQKCSLWKCTENISMCTLFYKVKKKLDGSRPMIL
nr:hypothetical protein [Bacteroides zoogleoformans]